jgi:glycosyltransferase involved in cell wall biosynthesis
VKILLANTYYHLRGGDSTYTLSLERLLNSKGHQVIPFSMKHKRNIPTPYEKYFVSEIDFEASFKNKSVMGGLKILSRIFHSTESIAKIDALITDYHPDIAHINNIRNHISPSIILELKKHNIPIVWTLHDYDLLCPNSTFLSHGNICESCKAGKYYWTILKQCKKNSIIASALAAFESYYQHYRGVFNLIDMFVTPSIFLRNKLIEYGFEPNRILHIPNFIDIENYEPSYTPGNYVVYVGRLSCEKGIYNLINAMGRIANLPLFIIGEGNIHKELEHYTKFRKYLNIHFLGYKSGSELSDIVKGSAFSILPSICYENNPYAIIEAFALGKPVLGSRIGGIPELIEDNVTGALFTPGDEDDLFLKINNLIKNQNKLLEMGKIARNKIEILSSPESHYKALIKLYHSIT